MAIFVLLKSKVRRVFPFPIQGAVVLFMSCLGAMPVAAATRGAGGVAFWATEVNDSWFNPFRWGGILPWQGGVPDQSASCRIELPVAVEILGQGQVAECLHIEFNHPQAGVRIVGSSHEARLTVHGTQIDNMATISVGSNDALSDSTLAIANNTNANGSGRIRLTSNDQFTARINPTFNTGWWLVNWPAHSILGSGEINVRLQNDGTIHADQAGRMLSFSGLHGVDNNGLVRASSGAGIHLRMGNGDFGFLQNSGGQIVVENSSALALTRAGNLGLRGGRLQTVGTGLITVYSQGFPIQDVELVAGSRLTFAGLAGLTVGPLGLVNDGLIFTGPNGFVSSEFGESATIGGNGRLQLEGGSLSAVFGGAGYALVNGPSHTIGGVGTVSLALTNRGAVLADRNGSGSGPGELLLQISPMTNEGLIEARQGGSIRLGGITLEQSLAGMLRAAASSGVVLQSATVRGGVIASSGDGVISVDGATSRIEDVHVAAGSEVLVPCFRELELSGGIDNDGRILVDNGGCGPNVATLRGVGPVFVDGTGSLRLAASSEFGDAATLDAGGQMLVLGADQRLTGYGRVSGTVRVDGTVAPDRTYAPAGDVGMFALNTGSDLTLASAAEFQLDIHSPSSFDRIAGSGDVHLGGTLRLAFPDAFVTDGEIELDIVVGSLVDGEFAQVVLPPSRRCGYAFVEVLGDRARLHLDVPQFCDGFEDQGP